jgi:hypothetical protein
MQNKAPLFHDGKGIGSCERNAKHTPLGAHVPAVPLGDSFRQFPPPSATPTARGEGSQTLAHCRSRRFQFFQSFYQEIPGYYCTNTVLVIQEVSHANAEWETEIGDG